MGQIKILKTHVDMLTELEFKKTIFEFLSGNNFGNRVGKINPEFVLLANKDKNFADTLNIFDLKIADGTGILWAGKYLSLPISKNKIIRKSQGLWQLLYTLPAIIFYPRYLQNPIPQKFPGVEALSIMLDETTKANRSVYFFGAEKNVLEKAINNLKTQYPKLKIAGYREGYDYNDQDVINDINQSGADLLIVALGFPKQEYWIRDNIARLKSVKIAVGEGGSLDFISGTHKRAPKWMRQIGCEWLWRLFMNKNKTKEAKARPKRVWSAVFVFIYEVFKYKLNNEN